MRTIIEKCSCGMPKGNHDHFEPKEEKKPKRAKRKARQSPRFQSTSEITKALASWDVLSKGGPGGGGWTPIPSGTKGGFRRGQPGSYEYWYPEKGEGADKRPATHEQHIEIPEYNMSVVAQAQGALTAEDVKRAKDIAKKVKSGIDKAADVCKLNPPVCKGNLGIPRMHMPQLMEKPISEMMKSDNPEDRKKAQAAIAAGADPDSPKSIFDQLLDSLKFKGVKVTNEEVPAGQLKATQREIQADKTYGMADSFLRGKYPKIAKGAIIISSDNHILDGHHRWAALLTAAPETKMQVIRVDMPMQEFLRTSFNQAGVFRADLQGDIVDPSTPLDLSGKNEEDVNKDAPSKPAPTAQEVAQTEPHPEAPQAGAPQHEGTQPGQAPVAPSGGEAAAAPAPGKTTAEQQTGAPAAQDLKWEKTPEGYQALGGRVKIHQKNKTITADGKAYNLPKKNASFGHAEGILAHHYGWKANKDQGDAMKSEIFEVDLSKGGEGSRGGHVIGHTGSGKPVYAKAHSAQSFTSEHSGWSKDDHYAAASVHERAAHKAPGPEGAKFHSKMATAHEHAAMATRGGADAAGHTKLAGQQAAAASKHYAGRSTPLARNDHAAYKSHAKEHTMFDPLDLVKGPKTADEITLRKAELAQETFTASDDVEKSEDELFDLVKGPRTPPAGARVVVGSVVMPVAPAAVLTPERSRPGLRAPSRILGHQHEGYQEAPKTTRAPDGTIIDPRSGLRKSFTAE